MGTYDGAEVCELVGALVLSKLANSTPKGNSGLNRDDGLILMKNENRQKTDRIKKEVIKIFKEIGFKIETKSNLEVVDFLDITFNLSNGTCKPYRKSNDKLLYINTSSNHSPKLLSSYQYPQPKAKNSSMIEIFNSAKVKFENALENYGSHPVKLNFTQTRENKPKHNRSQNIIWFNSRYTKRIITNVAKRFLNLLDHHFPKSTKLNKIFNRTTVNVSYSCTEIIFRIISSHNKKLMKNDAPNTKPCNCRTKSKMPRKRSMSISRHNLQMHCFNINKPR